MLGELPVNRTRANFTRRTHLRNFFTKYFSILQARLSTLSHDGRHAGCLHCLMTGDTLVLDSEWHWVFDCLHFDEVSLKLPVFESHYQ